MSNIVNLSELNNEQLTKYLAEHKLTETEYRNTFKQLTEKYTDICKNIVELNIKRSDCIDILKTLQNDYSQRMGYGEIKPVIDNDNDDDVTDEDDDVKKVDVKKTVVEKKGRKKNVAKKDDELVTIQENEDNEENEDIENVPKMKGKAKTKETKKTAKTAKTTDMIKKDGEEHNDVGNGEPQDKNLDEPIATRKGTRKKATTKK